MAVSLSVIGNSGSASTSDTKPTSTLQPITQQFATMIITAFSLIAALAWSDAIKAMMAAAFGTVDLPIINAVFVTLLTYIAAHTIGIFSRPACVDLCPAS